MDGVIHDRAAQVGTSHSEMERQRLDRFSLCRITDPENMAAMVTFLVSFAGRNVSGQSLGVDGNVESL